MLMSQDDLENFCPGIVDEIERFLQEKYKGKNEAVIYALGEILHNRLEVADLELEEKGAVVATLISGFVELNEDALAAHRQIQKIIREQKAGTVH
jgi:4-hydroxy-3-methylbut-2-enyl diphosphate reductase IspH